jgi:hypothetical protein
VTNLFQVLFEDFTKISHKKEAFYIKYLPAEKNKKDPFKKEQDFFLDGGGWKSL